MEHPGNYGGEEPGHCESEQGPQGSIHGDKSCFVVGIGASAGAQQPLEHLFATLPDDCYLAFVVIMHLPAEGPSLLADLIKRYTSMAVKTALDGVPLLPNTVHVIAPGSDLIVSDGRLRIERRSNPAYGANHSIDRFFTSLADEFGERAMGVVLSGFGTDGAQGIKRIKEGGGVVLVQDPKTAIHPSMPENAVATGAADHVAPVEEISEKMAEIARGHCDLPNRACQTTSLDEDLAAIFSVVKSATGHDFSSYKRNTVMRRIERRMSVNESGGLRKYLVFLEQNPREAQALAQEILIGVTRFFRDPEAFEVLRSEVIPRLFADRDPEDPVRIWHACCATGEEAYSVAMLIREHQEREGLNNRVQMFATDIDEGAVVQGRAGLYPEDIGSDVGEERLQTFFTRSSERLHVIKDLREMILFANHSLIKDPPFSRLDLLVCRNFLIYLNPDMQRRLISLFHLVLKPGGFLFLGASESVGPNSELFISLDKKWKIFQRRECDRRDEGIFPFAASAWKPTRSVSRKPPAEAESPSPGAMVERLLVERYAPPCVVVNEKYEVLHISSRTRRYLEIPMGKPTMEILKMVGEELRPALRAAIYKAFAEDKRVEFRGVKLAGEEGETTVHVMVEPLPLSPPDGRLALVILEPAPIPALDLTLSGQQTGIVDDLSPNTLVRQLEEQLRITHEQLQFTTEQLEASNEGFMATNEELMSINEEFQSANEELQSTNEELEASKEELQALNEELVTVNAELQGKVEEVNQANTDMENLFASSEIATIFLDRNFIIKRFSPAMAGILNLIPADIGRPFRHLSGTLDWSGLPRDAREVLGTLQPIDREVASVEDERFFIMRVLPYLTRERNVDGIVVTLTDITELKQAEAEIRSTALFPTENPGPVLRIGCNGEILFANRSAEMFLSRWCEESGREIPDSLRRCIDETLSEGLLREHDVDFSGGCMSFNVVPLPDRGYANLYGRDITRRKQAEEAVRQANEEWRRTFDSVPDLIAILDDKHRITRVNRAMADKLGLAPADCIGRTCFECVHGTEEFPDFCLHAQTLKDGLEHAREVSEGTLGGDFLVSTTPLKNEEGRMIGSVHVARDISERKRMENALRESEQSVKKKLASILSPDGDIGNLELKDILDIPSLQSLMEDFYDLSGVPMGLFDLQGNRLVGVGWQKVCTDFHRQNPPSKANCLESDTQLSAGIPEGEYRIYKCKNGMWDIATPIMVGGKHLGNLFLGQFFFEDEQPDYDFFRYQAARFGFPEEQYMAALDSVPRYSRERVDKAMAFFMKLSGIISRLSYANIELARTIGEREGLMTTLRQSESFYRQTLESIPGMVFTTRPDGYCDYRSRQWVEYTGVPTEEHLGDGWNRLLHPEDQPRALEAWRTAVEGWAPYDLEYRVRRYDGTYEWFKVIGRPIHDEAGGIERWFGVALNIEELKQAEEALRNSEERLSLIFNSAHDAIFVHAPDQEILAVNEKMLQLYGVSRKEALYAHRVLDFSAEEGREEEARELWREVLAGHSRLVEWQGKNLRTGKVFDAEIFLTGIDYDGREAILATVRDITDRKRAEEALQKAHGELEAKVEQRTAELREKDRMLLQQSRQAAMGEMINNIAHQWRQPLNGLGLIVQSLPIMFEAGRLDREDLADIEDKAMQIVLHMSQTIDDFRNFFKQDREKVWFKVRQSVFTTIKMIEKAFKNLNIDIEVSTTDDPTAFGYPNEFGQVLLNILINARDAFSERKVKTPKIFIDLGTVNERVIITISDNAGGIQEEIIDRIFEPYFTTKGPEHGTGIGLFMSKTIIEKNMGGKLVARNTADGAEFRIEV